MHDDLTWLGVRRGHPPLQSACRVSAPTVVEASLGSKSYALAPLGPQLPAALVGGTQAHAGYEAGLGVRALWGGRHAEPVVAMKVHDERGEIVDSAM